METILGKQSFCKKNLRCKKKYTLPNIINARLILIMNHTSEQNKSNLVVIILYCIQKKHSNTVNNND